METNDFSLKMRLSEFKNDIFISRKYWILYLVLISAIFFSLMGLDNYAHPKMEILVFVLMSIFQVQVH